MNAFLELKYLNFLKNPYDFHFSVYLPGFPSTGVLPSLVTFTRPSLTIQHSFSPRCPYNHTVEARLLLGAVEQRRLIFKSICMHLLKN